MNGMPTLNVFSLVSMSISNYFTRLFSDIQSLYTNMLNSHAHSKGKMKGQLADLPSAAIGLGVFVMIVAIVVIILVAFNGSTTNTDAQEIIGEGVDAMGTFGDYTVTIAIVIISGVLIGLVLGYFYGRSRRAGRA